MAYPISALAEAAHRSRFDEYILKDRRFWVRFRHRRRGIEIRVSWTELLVLQDVVDDAIHEGQLPEARRILACIQQRLHRLTGERLSS